LAFGQSIKFGPVRHQLAAADLKFMCGATVSIIVFSKPEQKGSFMYPNRLFVNSLYKNIMVFL